MAAALQASQAARRQEERGQVHESGNQKPRKEEKMDTDELRSSRNAVKPPNDIQGKNQRVWTTLWILSYD